MYVRFELEKRLGEFRLIARGVLKEGATCVIGPNGAGKTTLLKILAGVVKPDVGFVEYSGVRSKVYVGDWHVPPDATVLDVVLTGRTRFSGRPVGKDDVSAAVKYAELVGVGHLLRRRWSTLSGGQRQLAIIAAALASEADLLLLDEPMANLHVDRRGELAQLLRKVAQGRILVYSTHHFDVLNCCDFVVLMEDGEIKWAGSPHCLDYTRLTKPTACSSFNPNGVESSALQCREGVK